LWKSRDIEKKKQKKYIEIVAINIEEKIEKE